MRLEDCTIIDIKQDPVLEAKIINCFIEKGNMVLIGAAEFSKADMEWCNKHNIDYDLDIVSKPWGFDKPVFSSYELWYDFPSNSRVEKKVNWYNPMSEEELTEVIRKEGCTYSFRILESNCNIVDYTYELIMDEHCLIDGIEHRCLVINKRNDTEVSESIIAKVLDVIR